jgi:hypothetical protein
VTRAAGQRLLRREIEERFGKCAVLVSVLTPRHAESDSCRRELSFQRKDRPKPPTEDSGNADVDSRGEKRTNDTHESKTDPQARLFRKARGHEAKLCYMGHVLMEYRNGLAVGGVATIASGYAEREAALELLSEQPGNARWTLAADKAYDEADFVRALRETRITPHVSQNTSNRSSTIDARTTRHPEYAISQQKRKRVEEIFGWLKTIGLLRKVKHRGRVLVDALFRFGLDVYNLVRIRNLAADASV